MPSPFANTCMRGNEGMGFGKCILSPYCTAEKDSFIHSITIGLTIMK
jgi:hypothetical protein